MPWRTCFLTVAAIARGVRASQEASCPQGQIPAVIDFEGFDSGAEPHELCFNKGISSLDQRFGLQDCFNLTSSDKPRRKRFPKNQGHMIFDAACGGPPNGTDDSGCTGNDQDLFEPAEGKVLIFNGDSSPGSQDPNDHAYGGEFFFWFNTSTFKERFSNVHASSITLLDYTRRQFPAIFEAHKELDGTVTVDSETQVVPHPMTPSELQTIHLDFEDVHALIVTFRSGGAVARINLCLEARDATTSTSSSTSSSISSSTSNTTSTSTSSDSSTSSSSSTSLLTSTSTTTSTTLSSRSSASSSSTATSSSFTSTTTSTTTSTSSGTSSSSASTSTSSFTSVTTGVSTSTTTSRSTSLSQCRPGFIPAVIDFEGDLKAGLRPDKLCFGGGGIAAPGASYGDTVCTNLTTTGDNAGAMLFDATCGQETDGTDRSGCSGRSGSNRLRTGDTDLFQPLQGNVLVLQTNRRNYRYSDPNDDRNGGCFSFAFNTASFEENFAGISVAFVTLLDVENRRTVITAHLNDGDSVKLKSQSGIDGGMQRLDINVDEVMRLDICLMREGAVGDIGLCLAPLDLGAPLRVLHQSPPKEDEETPSWPSGAPESPFILV